MDKISILGGSGSGKSTLACDLGKKYNLPVIHMDKLFFKENWEQNTFDYVLDQLDEVMGRNRWIVDGNYSKFHFSRRIEDSDLIIFLDYGRMAHLYGAISRYFKHRGSVRESVADGCIEKLDWGFISYILFEQPKKLKEMRNDLVGSEDIIYFNSRKELRKWVNSS